MLGRRLVEGLSSAARLRGRPVERVHALDVVDAPVTDGAGGVVHVVADLSAPGTAEAIIDDIGPDVVFHLAGVVSGEAEADFDKGMRVNLDATRALFDALRKADGCPRVVFTSSIAVFGAPFPDVIDDDFAPRPLTSYGAQKLASEVLLADYSRRGFIDGVGIRLPTITVRPGAPNAAASGFFSGIIREPLAGMRAPLPVSRSVCHPHASPRSAIGFLLHAAELDTELLGARRNLTMPSVSVTVEDQIDALVRAAGPDVAGLIDEVDDPAVAAIVAGWPARFRTDRADALGFRCETSFDEIVAAHIADTGRD